jgi:hypothetical protein
VVLHAGRPLRLHWPKLEQISSISIINGYLLHLDSHTIHNLTRYDPAVKFVEDDTILVPILGVGSEKEVDVQPA